MFSIPFKNTLFPKSNDNIRKHFGFMVTFMVKDDGSKHKQYCVMHAWRIEAMVSSV